MSYPGIHSWAPSGAALKQGLMKAALISITTPPCPTVRQMLGCAGGIKQQHQGGYLGWKSEFWAK